MLASRVLSNNVQVAFMAFASGLSAGIFTVLILLFNGISIGAALGLFSARGVGRIILDFVIAHSAFELTAICVAAGAGFRDCRRDPAARRTHAPGSARAAGPARTAPAQCGRADARFSRERIEGLISPRADLPLAFKAAVAAVSALLVVVYASLGRGASPDDTSEVMAYRTGWEGDQGRRRSRIRVRIGLALIQGTGP